MSSKKHEVPEALLTSLLTNYQKPEDLIGENGLLKQLTILKNVTDLHPFWEIKKAWNG